MAAEETTVTDAAIQKILRYGSALALTLLLLATSGAAHAQALRPGVMGLIPFRLNGQNYFIAYREGTTDARFYRLSPDGWSWEQLSQYYLGTIGGEVMPYEVNGQPYFLYYDDFKGSLTFNRILPDGGHFQALGTTAWAGDGWSLTPYQVNGQPYFIAYSANSGQVFFNHILPNGAQFERVATYIWDKSLVIRVYTVNGAPYFVTYPRGKLATKASFYHILPDGAHYEFLTTRQFDKGWSHLVFFPLNGDLYLLRYLGLGNGTGNDADYSLDRISASGQLFDHIDPNSWDEGYAFYNFWDSLMWFNVNGETHTIAARSDTGLSAIIQMPW